MSNTPVVRTTDRNNFKRCRQEWDFSSKIRMDLEPNSRSRVALDFGTAIHAGLEAYYNPVVSNQSDEFRMQLCLSEFLRSWLTARPNGDPALEEEWNEYNLLGINMLKGYVKHYFQADQNFKCWAVELEFSVPITVPQEGMMTETDDLAVIGGKLVQYVPDFVYQTYDWKPVQYQGRIDAIWIDDNDQYWIVDHKTAARWAETNWLDLDEQCGSYLWAMKQLHPDKKWAGVIYNELKKAAPKKPAVLKSGKLSVNKQQSTTHSIFLSTVEERGLNPNDYTEFLDYLVANPPEFFRRTQVHRNNREIALQGERIFYEAVDMLNNPNIYPTPTKFNCNYCSFMGPCVSKWEGSDYLQILSSNYHKRGLDSAPPPMLPSTD